MAQALAPYHISMIGRTQRIHHVTHMKKNAISGSHAQLYLTILVPLLNSEQKYGVFVALELPCIK